MSLRCVMRLGVAALWFALIALTACGQKGALYLPQQPQPVQPEPPQPPSQSPDAAPPPAPGDGGQ